MPRVSTPPTLCERSVTKPAELSHSDPAGLRRTSAQDAAMLVAEVELLTQLARIASAPNPWIAPLSLMSYQSAVIARRGMKRGWRTMPTVLVVAFSGLRSG